MASIAAIDPASIRSSVAAITSPAQTAPSASAADSAAASSLVGSLT